MDWVCGLWLADRLSLAVKKPRVERGFFVGVISNSPVAGTPPVQPNTTPATKTYRREPRVRRPALPVFCLPHCVGVVGAQHYALVVADVGALDPEDDVFRDVGGVVCDALEVAADHQSVKSLRSDVALLFHNLSEGFVGGAVHRIDGVVHGENNARQFGIGFNKSL